MNLLQRTLATAALTLTLGLAPGALAHAQEPPPAGPQGAPAPPERPDARNAPVSLDLRDAPLRNALEQLFTTARVQFSVSPRVSGFVTLKIADQPFDSALRLLLRSADVPLTYTVENGVYIVKLRDTAAAVPAEFTPPPAEAQPASRGSLQIETITLTYLDPYDLQQIMPVQTVPTFARSGNPTPGNIGIVGGGLNPGGANNAGPGAAGRGTNGNPFGNFGSFGGPISVTLGGFGGGVILSPGGNSLPGLTSPGGPPRGGGAPPAAPVPVGG